MRLLKVSLLPVLMAALFLSSGCKTFTVKPGADPLIVYAEYSAEMSLKSFDLFLKWEYDNRAILSEKMPEVGRCAESIRQHGVGWIDELLTAKKAYKANPSAENMAALKTAQAFLEYAVAEARSHMVGGVPKNP